MKINYCIIYFTITISSILFSQDCIDGVEVELWGECYSQSDINFLQGLINNSQNSENSPDINIEPINLGDQTWENNRLIEFCSSNTLNSGSDCYTDYVLSGIIPSLTGLDALQYLDLRNNMLTNLEATESLSNLEYLYLSDNLINTFPESIYNMSSLKELHISNNYINSIIETDEVCSFFSDLLSYNISGNYICNLDSPDCIDISGQNALECCDESAGNDYINYFGECYFENDFNIINELDSLNINVVWNNNDKVIQLDLSNNQLIQIPDNIWGLEQLQSLYLNNNSITTFPSDSLSSLNNMETLDLSSNLITYLDENACESYNALNFTLTLNPICESENLLSCLDDNVCFVADCSDLDACNYNPYTTYDDGSCVYPVTNYDCDNNCIIDIDECGECGGLGILIGTCDCEGTLPVGGYDCEGNQLDLNNNIPFKFEIIDIFPNPFNPNTTISFSTDSYNNITINIFNLDGALVDEILNEYLYPGIHHIEWLPNNLSNGLYLVSINNGQDNVIQKVTLLK